MNIEEIINSYGKPIKIIGDQRTDPRFKIANLKISINSKLYDIENISLHGIGFNHFNDYFPLHKEVSGDIFYQENKINISLICMHNNSSFAGFKIVHNASSIIFLNNLLSPENIAQNLKLKRIKNSNWLCYSYLENKFLINFSDESKQVSCFLFSMGTNIIYWNDQGIHTGEYNPFIDNPRDSLDSIKPDTILDYNKIKFFKNIIKSNTTIPNSFKDWIIDKINSEI